MPSFIYKHAPWGYSTIAEFQRGVHYFYAGEYNTHVVHSGTCSHSVHRSEADAAAMAERLNLMAAEEIMTGSAPNHTF